MLEEEQRGGRIHEGGKQEDKAPRVEVTTKVPPVNGGLLQSNCDCKEERERAILVYAFCVRAASGSFMECGLLVGAWELGEAL